jgi:putative membrane protein
MKKLMFYMLLAGAAFAQAAEPGRVKPPLLDIEHILAVLVYSVIGIVVMVVSFAIIDWIHPRDIWGEIADKQNRAMAIVFGCMMLGIAIIIAAAVAG